MIAAGGKEQRRGERCGKVETERAMVELLALVQIADVEMNVTDDRSRRCARPLLPSADASRLFMSIGSSPISSFPFTTGHSERGLSA